MTLTQCIVVVFILFVESLISFFVGYKRGCDEAEGDYIRYILTGFMEGKNESK